MRLLLGAEPERPERRLRPFRESSHPGRAAHARLRRVLEGHAHELELDRDLLGFDIDADQTARRLVAWLGSGKVEVRRLEDGFLHGKAFIVTTDDEGVIAGSSNFTYAGLATNIELNLGDFPARDRPTGGRLVRRPVGPSQGVRPRQAVRSPLRGTHRT